jgi:3-hydroxyisobutyrate dehydrogenase
LKDVELFLREASGYALTASSLEGFRPVLERTIAQGLGDSDYSAIFEFVNPIPSP